jgi:lipooligosaccharide transport system permease protein
MFGTLVKRQYQRTYDAILAAPVDTEELVTAEMLWIAARAGTYGCVPMIVAMFFGLDPSWGMLAVPFIGMVAGFGWAGFGTFISSLMDSFENFSYVISAVLTPLFLLAGTFFPLDELPEWAQVLAWLNPLYSLVELVRSAVFGWEGAVDVAHAAILIGFGLLTWRLAVSGMTRKLIL